MNDKVSIPLGITSILSDETRESPFDKIAFLVALEFVNI